MLSTRLYVVGYMYDFETDHGCLVLPDVLAALEMDTLQQLDQRTGLGRGR